jgi:hypothetical protein
MSRMLTTLIVCGIVGALVVLAFVVPAVRRALRED